eukprot:CAMPEP_0172034470 /NCGR_PEP_ID=MMETSP1041-20130122/21031_1 /TAXON_ID=464988 /ORGANISM="Hemiselmis andersenii, Strain CCMP439" /LENGTH=36 /DNA_ID= /DNA_START= /DNA_END= /DNA_ORIENTATION=
MKAHMVCNSNAAISTRTNILWTPEAPGPELVLPSPR